MGNPEPIGQARAVRRAVRVMLGAVLLMIGAIAGAVFLLDSGKSIESPDAAPIPPDTALVVGSGEVDVEGGLLPLAPLPTGLIHKVIAREGQRVEEGAALVELDSTGAQAQLEEAKLKARLAAKAIEQANETARQHRETIRLQEVAVEVVQVRLEGLDPQIKRLEDLVIQKLGAQHETELKAILNQQAVLRKTLESEQLKLTQMRAIDPQIAVRLAEAQREVAEHAVSVAATQVKYYTLRAPVAGVVLRVLARQGQLWGPQSREPAVWFQPDRPWVVRCEIDQQFVTRIEQGMPCDVIDDRAETVAWKGTVKSISGWVGPRRIVTEDLTAWRDVRMVECFIALDGSPLGARIGQRVRVVIRTGGRP